MSNDIYEQLGNLYNQLYIATSEVENVTKKSNEKIKELMDICTRYAEEAYRFIGYLKENYNINSKDLDTYKYIIDSCIANEEYKKELEHKYITKDLKDYYKTKVEEMSEASEKDNDAFISIALRSNRYKEDDTETIQIIEKE